MSKVTSVNFNNRQKDFLNSAVTLRRAQSALAKAQVAKIAAEERHEEARIAFNNEVQSTLDEAKVQRT